MCMSMPWQLKIPLLVVALKCFITGIRAFEFVARDTAGYTWVTRCVEPSPILGLAYARFLVRHGERAMYANRAVPVMLPTSMNMPSAWLVFILVTTGRSYLSMQWFAVPGSGFLCVDGSYLW